MARKKSWNDIMAQYNRISRKLNAQRAVNATLWGSDYWESNIGKTNINRTNRVDNILSRYRENVQKRSNVFQTRDSEGRLTTSGLDTKLSQRVYRGLVNG